MYTDAFTSDPQIKPVDLDLMKDCIKALVITDGTENVQLKKFEKFLDWFGPAQRGEAGKRG